MCAARMVKRLAMNGTRSVSSVASGTLAGDVMGLVEVARALFADDRQRFRDFVS